MGGLLERLRSSDNAIHDAENNCISCVSLLDSQTVNAIHDAENNCISCVTLLDSQTVNAIHDAQNNCISCVSLLDSQTVRAWEACWSTCKVSARSFPRMKMWRRSSDSHLHRKQLLLGGLACTLTREWGKEWWYAVGVSRCLRGMGSESF
jgi:disulfide oxidoreductase YuzD